MKIGQIDLRLPLTPSLIDPVKKWVATFAEQNPLTSYHPFVDENGATLNMCSLAFPGFMGFVDMMDSTELEVRRLRRSGEYAMRRVMARKRDPLIIESFRQTLEMLDRIGIGELTFPPKTLPPTHSYAPWQVLHN